MQLHRLTDDQAFTLKAAFSGHNVFITGQAGTGKSFLVKEIFQQLEQSGKNVAFISSTGISGTLYTDLKSPVPTVHSFYGIGTADLPWKLLVQKASSNNLIQEQVRKVDCLMWDEASMTSRRIFEICNVIHLTVGGNTEHKHPFGGKQVVLVGENFQLRPVPNQFDDRQFMFCSPLFGRAFPHRYQLFTVVRHDLEEVEFLQCLSEVRLGKCNERANFLLTTLARDIPNPQMATHMYFRKISAELHNLAVLRELPGEAVRLESIDTGDSVEESSVQPIKYLR